MSGVSFVSQKLANAQIFFLRRRYGGERMPSQLLSSSPVDSRSPAPTNAWLAVLGEAAWNRRVLDRLLAIDPAILLAHGDPERLSVDARKNLLRAVIVRYADRTQVRVDVDVAQLKRLAHPELVNDVNAALANRTLAADIRELFLRL